MKAVTTARGKTQVAVQAVPHVVAIERVGDMPEHEQPLLQLESEGGFTRAAQAGQPDGRRILAQQLRPFFRGDFPFDPGNVAADYLNVFRCCVFSFFDLHSRASVFDLQNGQLAFGFRPDFTVPAGGRT
ncbi:MAG: hypothetical protein FD134_855 [Gallionellaceae bacterium]|nr:MAG: hypothetical protein FD134_855 [Gallionellaceae bacterium]